MRARLVAPLAVVALAVSLWPLSCSTGRSNSPQVVTGADPSAGKVAITHYGCGSCHTIPGVKGAVALVGPPLIHWSRRSFVAGKLANTPDNLVSWLEDPQAVWPGNDMPDLGISPTDARNIAAYLDGIR
jgi:cytochrome c2